TLFPYTTLFRSGRDGARGVHERLALGRAGARRGEVDDVGREPLARDLERRPRARGALVEEIDDGLTAQRGDLLDLPRGDLLQRGRGVHQREDLGCLQLADGQEILPRPAHAQASSGSSITTRSSPSCSVSRTATVSRRDVGRFLPM